MLRVIQGFWISEDGAVTIDWVVLTAAIVGLGTAVVVSISNGAVKSSNSLGSYLYKEDVTTTY